MAAIKNNLPTMVLATNMEALEQLASIVKEATEKPNTEQELNKPCVQAPRVEQNDSAPRVEQIRQTQKVSTKSHGGEYDFQVEDPQEGLIVASPQERVDGTSKGPTTRSRAQMVRWTITQELLLAACEIANYNIEPRKVASQRYPLRLLCELAGAVMDKESGELFKYLHLMSRPKYKEVWGISLGNEIGRLVQGMPGSVDGTNTIFFISKDDVPRERLKDVMYGKFVVDYRENKQEK